MALGLDFEDRIAAFVREICDPLNQTGEAFDGFRFVCALLQSGSIVVGRTGLGNCAIQFEAVAVCPGSAKSRLAGGWWRRRHPGNPLIQIIFMLAIGTVFG